MTFEISRTPTLEAVATGDDLQLETELKARTAAVIEEADQQGDVRAAAEMLAASRERLVHLRRAERRLSEYGKEVEEKVTALRESALDALIATAVAGEKPEFKPLTEVGTWESRARAISRAIQRLVETLLPVAEWTALREESHWMMAKSRALEQMAQERAEKLLGQMRDAVMEEMVLPVDLSKGVSGALLGQAAELRSRAIQISENADRIEKMPGFRR
ncbi:MAG: hypothetical protein ABL967_14810 [Bryobacteraceae bacterium]